MGNFMSMSPGQGLALTNVMTAGSADFKTPEQQMQQAMTTNPLTALSLNQSVSQLNSLGQAIQRSIYELSPGSPRSDKPLPATDPVLILVNSYSSLLFQIQQYVNLAPSIDPAVLNKKVIEFRTKMIALDDKKLDIINAPSTTGVVLQAFHYYCVNSLYFFGPLFAIILVMNGLYYNASSNVPDNIHVFYKVFYAFWAALWYPLVLIYGIIDPPVYRSLFPLFAKDDPKDLNPIAIFNFLKPGPKEDPIILERGKTILRLVSIILFTFFMYVFVFYFGTTPSSKMTFSSDPGPLPSSAGSGPLPPDLYGSGPLPSTAGSGP